jgi:hypothetical protein
MMLENLFVYEKTKEETLAPGIGWIIFLILFCAFVLFAALGSAALFEPDEGRNAEVGREILLLKDWVTPHYDFIPRLDKPISFFWLVALSYKFFGISEWSARLPSALAALGCLSLAYGFARSLFGPWAGLWSALILVTSVEFFGLSHVVILDMTLTFFMTLALCCFFLGQLAVDRGKKRAFFLLMYPAIGAATLVKGPIGFLLPAMVIFFYLLLSRRWTVIREMEIALGIPLFLLTMAPWYALAELRNPGYLHHFLSEENVARFTTTQFKRTGPWYYFIGVLAGGFFPWTVFFPTLIVGLWKRSLKDEHLFLILWIALPLLFFSVSSSKLPHYILPIYPPLAIIVGATIVRALTDSTEKKSWVHWFPAVTFILLSFVLTLVVLWPVFLPYRLQAYIHDIFSRPPISVIVGLGLTPVLALLAISKRQWAKQEFLYPATAFGFALFVLFAVPIITKVSLTRSSKQLAERVAPLIRDEDQLVIYGGYPSGLPFYLNIQKPIWVVWSGRKGKVLGSDYVAEKQPEPAAGYGQILFTNEEFADLWKTSKHRLLVFVDREAVSRLAGLGGALPRTLLQIGDISLVTRSEQS